ncbi:hypothetical protein ACFVXQ_34620, partial [Kitasatospora sp. NPDC058263]
LGQYRAAQQDQDTAAHVAAVRALIANAAGVAAQANQDAAEASAVAARARSASEEAGQWADRARASAAQAKGYADEARNRAAEATASATAAASSAQQATTAAVTARLASRQANYSASQAASAAHTAVASADGAAASAAGAREAALAAGKSQEEARQAANEAGAIATRKYAQEQAAEAARAAEQARQDAANHVNRFDNAAYETVQLFSTPGPDTFIDPKALARRYATLTGDVSTWLGGASVLSLLGGPPGLAFSETFGATSLVTGGVSALLSGYGHGWTSSQFKSSVTMFSFNLLLAGQGYTVKKFADLGPKIADRGAQAVIGGGSAAVNFITSKPWKRIPHPW